ncbi:AFG1-like ATPase-domain-containing protein [Globomyces pollinis-pini]|nr:AFG1-like ATPase-domain-containing protein [Globomyces pollinis-pini]
MKNVLKKTKEISGALKKYQELIDKNELKYNPDQLKTIKKLNNLQNNLINYNPKIKKSESLFKKIQLKQNLKSPDFNWIHEQKKLSLSSKISSYLKSFKKINSNNTISTPNGLYLYGSVGTGKSMLMDLFYNTMPIERKRRVHFHAFMQDIHKRIHQLRMERGIGYDPSFLIAEELAADAWLLCFDEFQVTDIADAMLLRRLCAELFNNGVVMVATSNRHPDDLYQNGIQRASFLPTIELLKQKCDVHNLDSGIDYRKEEQERVEIFFHPLNTSTTQNITNLFNRICNGKPVTPTNLNFLGRSLIIQETCGRTAKLSFKQICGEPHSAADYLQLAERFDIIILTDIPKLTLDDRNEVRRFITLIDALYDTKVKLIATMEAPLSGLFTGDHKNTVKHHETDQILFDDLKLDTKQLSSAMFTGVEEVFAFERALSRLIEMQGISWIGSELSQIIKENHH